MGDEKRPYPLKEGWTKKSGKNKPPSSSQPRPPKPQGLRPKPTQPKNNK